MNMDMDGLYIVGALLLGVVAHVLKKVVQARETDKTFSLKRYLTDSPYKTALTVFYAIAGAAGLHAVGELSVYSALLTGFAANSASGKSDSES